MIPIRRRPNEDFTITAEAGIRGAGEPDIKSRRLANRGIDPTRSSPDPGPRSAIPDPRSPTPIIFEVIDDQ